jgi:hypothetical protein
LVTEFDDPPPPQAAAATSVAMVRFRRNFISTAPELAEVLPPESDRGRLSSLSAREGLSLSTAFVGSRVDSASSSADVFTVTLDQLGNFSSLIGGMRTSVSDGAAQPNIIADEVFAIGVGQDFLDVGLADPEAAVSVASVMGLVALGHLLFSFELTGARVARDRPRTTRPVQVIRSTRFTASD